MLLIHPDDAWERLNPCEINARHIFSLPGIRCPKCRVTWATTGVAYPTVSPDVVKHQCAGIPTGRPMSPEQFYAVAHGISQVIGDQYPIYPGTDFGALQGKRKGVISDFVWLNPWTPLIHKSAFDQVVKKGLQFKTATALLDAPIGDVLEIEAIPSVALHPKCLAIAKSEVCSTCGRKAYQMPDQIVLDGGTIPQDQIIMRIREFPTLLVVSNITGQVLTEMKFDNFTLTEVETAE